MGGGSGGGLSTKDIESLESSAKQKLKAATSGNDETGGSSCPHVFISFSHDNINDINLFRAQARNDNTELEFDDHSLKEPYDSTNADYIKRGIRDRIDRCSVTIVYLTEDSADSKWVNWEIEESIKRGKGVIGFYSGDSPPKNFPPAFRENNCKAEKWSHEALNRAIEEACKNR
ncbi:MAG: TIR domain-containing protein [Alphaproteobacteria bacterium]|nr:MAG: TIR domain-containing protein [Alphaproteobacteria bacterium]